MTKVETKDETIQGLMATINNLNEEIALLREQVAYLTQKRYGKSSEQMPLTVLLLTTPMFLIRQALTVILRNILISRICTGLLMQLQLLLTSTHSATVLLLKK